MNKISIGIVGCGRIGQRHAEHIAKVARLVAVCDIVESKAENLGKAYDAAVYHSMESLLLHPGELDLVAICTPNGLHAQHSILALKHGKHVLCEKPMAIRVSDCGEMIKTAEQHNRRLFIVKQNRFNPPVAAVKNLLDEGRLGRIYSVQLNCFWNRNDAYYENSWKGTNNLDGGTLFTQFSHFIDLLYWLVGDVNRVYALVDNFHHRATIEFEDTGVVVLEFLNGAIGTIHYTVNAFEKNMEGSITIFGEKGTVKVGGQYLNELEYQSIHDFHIENLPPGNKPNHYGTYQGSMSNHDKVYENVVDVICHGGSIMTNLFDGLKTVEIIEKIYRSARQNRH
jgi:predicted dehydrogenase